MQNEKTQWYALEPTDAWFFRDGRPSNRGEDQSDLESIFPPNARTLVGALRAALARSGPEKWDGRSSWEKGITDVLGDGDDLKNLSFMGPFLSLNGDLLFPLPSHILGIESEENGKKIFKPKDWLVPSKEPLLTDLGKVFLPLPLKQREKPDKEEKNKEERPSSTQDFFVTKKGLDDVLKGTLPDSNEFIHRSDLFSLEPRVGIELDKTSRTTKNDGGLYNPVYVRLYHKGVQLVMGISGLPNGWELPDYFPLGGESRLAACEKIVAQDFPRSVEGGQILILLTPARFDNLWYGAGPGKDASALSAEFSGKIKTASFDRPMGIGGWNSVNRKEMKIENKKEIKVGPLPLKPFVKAGAVWWLDESQMVNSDSVLKLGNETGFGYGIALIGKQA